MKYYLLIVLINFSFYSFANALGIIDSDKHKEQTKIEVIKVDE